MTETKLTPQQFNTWFRLCPEKSKHNGKGITEDVAGRKLAFIVNCKEVQLLWPEPVTSNRWAKLRNQLLNVTDALVIFEHEEQAQEGLFVWSRINRIRDP